MLASDSSYPNICAAARGVQLQAKFARQRQRSTVCEFVSFRFHTLSLAAALQRRTRVATQALERMRSVGPADPWAVRPSRVPYVTTRPP